jgi:sulfur carrier protein ThiS
MRIIVNIYAYLRYYLPDLDKFAREREWEVPDGIQVDYILKELKLPGEIRVIILLNNNCVAETAALKEGDIVHILPQVVGG